MTLRRLPERLAWWALVRVCHFWATRYLDQWDKFRLDTEYGPVYVGLERETMWPESFDAADRGGRAVRGEGR